MNEEAINLIFDWAVGNGYKGTKEEWLNYIQTNDDAFNYVYDIAKRRGYQKDENAFGVLMGRTAPVATTEPAKTEPAKTEPAVTIATETAPAKTEPAKELSNKPLGTVKAESIPQREVEMPVADTNKMPPMTVKEAEPEVKEEPKKDMPIGDNLLPVTEKTEVKAVETPSDKMVIKSEKKGKMKVAPEPIKIEPIKVETKGGQIQVEVPTFAIPEPKKKYKPYGEKGPDVYYSEEYDQYIIKEGDSKTIVNKGSGKYEEITNKISESVGSTKEGKGKCDTPPFIGCSKEQTALSDFKYYKGDDYAYGSGRTEEGGLIETLDYRKKFVENNGESIWALYGEGDDLERKTEGDIYYANQEPPKSDRFITYKPFGNDKTLIYDKESGIILKQLDQKAPFVDLSSTNQVIDEKGNIVQKASDPRTYWQKYAKENPNEGLTVWQGFEIDHPEYKELKSIIEGIDYQKAKGGTTAPKVSNVPTLEPWQQPQGTMQVKEVTEQPKAEVKAEEPKGIPSYDDLGIEKGTNLLTNTPYVLPKGIKYKEMSPSEIISTVVDENGFVSRNGIKLNRNTSLRYPDPPGTVFKKEKVGEREVYSSYDKSNGKWYIYDENSNKDNWTEVKAGPIKTLLNSKFSDKEDKEKIDKVTEDERNLIDKTRNSVYVNVYMPYLLKNEDKLSDEESLKLQKMIKGIAHFKTLEAHFKEEPFTGSLEEYLEKKNKHISDTREMPEIKDITDKKHLQIINDIVARTDNENGYFKQFFESKNYPTENFSYSELENRKSNNELDSYKSILGTVFYDKNKDEFYWTEYDKKRIAREKYNHVYEGDKLEFDEKSQLPYLIIKKGTPDYDKIKSSLSKYNK